MASKSKQKNNKKSNFDQSYEETFEQNMVFFSPLFLRKTEVTSDY